MYPVCLERLRLLDNVNAAVKAVRPSCLHLGGCRSNWRPGNVHCLLWGRLTKSFGSTGGVEEILGSR